MNHKEGREGFANYAYHHSETLEMDRSAQGRSLSFHTSTLQSHYQENPFDSPDFQRRWEWPEILQMRSMESDQSTGRPALIHVNPYENEVGYDNPVFENLEDDSSSTVLSVEDGYRLQVSSYIPDMHREAETTIMEPVTTDEDISLKISAWETCHSWTCEESEGTKQTIQEIVTVSKMNNEDGRVQVSKIDETDSHKDSESQRFSAHVVIELDDSQNEPVTVCQWLRHHLQLAIAVILFFFHYFKESYPESYYTEVQRTQPEKWEKASHVGSERRTTILSQEVPSEQRILINIDEVTLTTLNKINDARWKAAAQRRRTVGVTKRLASLAGLTLSQYSLPEAELSEEEREDKVRFIAELAKLSHNERMKAIQQLTMSIEEKREIRDQVEQTIGPYAADTGAKIHQCTQLLYKLLFSLQRFRENMVIYFQLVHPWKRSLKIIGGKFGTSVLSYFTFLKWLFMFNMFSFLINFSFITIPQFFDMGINNLTFTGLELLTGSGYFTQTVFYYGFYTNMSIQANPTAKMYNMQVAYFLTIGCYMLSCFLYLVYSMAKSFNENFIAVGILSGDAAKLLCSWDFNITNEKAVELKKRNISRQLKEMLSEKMHYHRQLSTKQRILRNLIHLMAWIISLGTTYGCCFGIHSFSISNFKNIWYHIYTTGRVVCIEFLGKRANYRSWMNWLVEKLNSGEDFDPAKEKAAKFSLLSDLAVAGRPTKRNQPTRLWAIIQKNPTEEELQKQASTLLLPFVVAIINLVIPLFFSFLGSMERFKYPRDEMYVLIIRNVVLKMSVIGVLCYYWLVTVANTVECWETFVGQDLYRLVVTDFIFSLLGSFFGEFIRSIMGTHCCHKLGKPEFDIPRNVLSLIYAQILAWIGLFFAPLLPAIQIIKFFIIFHVKKVSLMMNCQPPRKAWRASHMTTIFIFLLFFPGFLGVLCLLGITVWKWKPSKLCGPFRGLNVPYSSISHFIDKIQETVSHLHWLVWCYNNLILNPLFYFILTIIVFATIYLYLQIIDGRKLMIQLLQEHISNEGKDKAYLLQKLNSMKGKMVSSKEKLITTKISDEPNLYLDTNEKFEDRKPNQQNYSLNSGEDSVSAFALALAAKHQAEDDPNE